ncbi:DUF2383 domain-containing protein [Alteromonas sp. 345S023]|uniref:DUF2383 domain-containing protein n=1 Tax=Alteromonas profundi TaxID=2696062 RepID=A0A7X5LKQ8_9ALTE|nr:ferritin-like domain-containing protein [Alteromonas profundi]NDV91136.1 DUF2383 domain-containing protein [Alteromonas profundi]
MSSSSKVISQLCHLDFDAIAAYEASLERIEDSALKDTIAGFRDDHKAHTEALNAILVKRGEDKVTDTDYKKVLTKGKVVIAGLINDKAILKAMNVNEEVTTKAYEKALDNDDFSVEERAVIERHYNDEKRHKQWFSAAADKE